jgi:hypothetical protein
LHFPKAKISKIDPSGLLQIKFLQAMKIPANPTLIANDTILLNETEYPIKRLEVVPGKFSDPQMMKFNWSFVDYTP